ncbi:MAG: alpha/beta hydrolase [Desulfobacterales bacterium]|nr:alpha/beta hydrolase [Desulfobacterales bacterium]
MIEKQTTSFGWLAGQHHLDPNKKTILFIHGAGFNSHLWVHQIKRLAPHFNTVAIDLPGHHRSTGQPLTTIEAYGKSVMDFIEEAQLPQVVPCGLSMGGAIVLQMLLDSPHLFGEAILVNTGARLRVLPDILDAVQNHYEAYRTSLFHFAVPENLRTDALKEALLKATEPTGEATLQDLKACDIFDVMNKVQSISARTLVMGAEKDISTPLKYARLLSDNIKQSFLSEIKGCGHFSPLEAPERVSQVMEDFLMYT